MDLGLQERTAVVCASTGGLGEAIARALAAEGANVVVSGRRQDRAEQIARGLQEAGPGRAFGIGCDLMAERGADALHAAAIDAFGGIDVLVLNGPGPKAGGAADVTGDDVTQAVATLVRPQQRMVELTLPRMRDQKWGRILAVGSSGVQAPIPNLALSNIVRAALAGYLKTLAGEVASDGVTVNMLLPGRIDTDRVASLDAAAAELQGRTPEQVAEQSRRAIPAGRYGEPAEFGAVAAFLVSDAASYVTGTALRCDGGLIPVL
jgi:3-oxoacyl-[acyl-carrier protein] reductase